METLSLIFQIGNLNIDRKENACPFSSTIFSYLMISCRGGGVTVKEKRQWTAATPKEISDRRNKRSQDCQEFEQGSGEVVKHSSLEIFKI